MMNQGKRQAREHLIAENEIPSLPSSWEVERFRFLFRESKERNGTIPVGEMLSVSEYYGVVPKVYEHEEQRRTDEELESYRVVRPRQLAVNTMWLNHLGLGVSEYLGHVSPAYAVYNISKKIETRFAHHLFRSQYYLKIYLRYLYGIRPNSFQIKSDDWNSIPVILPPRETQKKIADFLDIETARIDQLIKKKERLVEVLNERERAIYDNAVLGLVETYKSFKTVNVPWIKKVPAHWTIQPIKRLLSDPITDGPHETPDFIDKGVIFISAESIQNGEIDFNKARGFISPEANDRYSRKYSPKIGDIYVVKSGATTGKSAMVHQFTDFNIWSPLAVLRASPKMDAEFLLMVVRSTPTQDAIALSWSWGTQQNIGMGVLGRILVPVPPTEEQEQLKNTARRLVVPLITNRTIIRDSIDRLREFRSALITSAVTGQIDVTTWSQRSSTDHRLDEIEKEMSA